MPLDGICMQAVAEELRPELLGLRIDKVQQPARDQVILLGRDNVVAEGARGFEALGITPTPMEAILTGYLYVYRPGGQYAAIKESATQLRA